MDRKKRAVIIKLKDQASRKCTEILQKQEEMKMGTIKIPAADVLKKIYGETDKAQKHGEAITEYHDQGISWNMSVFSG